MNIVRGAITGDYETSGIPAEADVVMGHSFGTNTSMYGVNRQIAEHAIFQAQDRLQIIVDETLAEAFPAWGREPDVITGGPISTTLGGGTGTWGSLLQARDFMNQQGYEQPLMVAQAFHVGRVALQARKLGMKPILPPDLPKQFDADSAQLWTRSRRLWIPREMAGLAYLKLKGQI